VGSYFAVSQICSFTEEYKFITWSLQWIGASKFSITQTGHQGLSHDVQGDEGKKEAAPIMMFL
jgi:hypothetical protein